MADGLTPEELREFEMITLELQRRGGGIFDEMVVASLGQPQPGPQVKILEAVHDGAYPRVGCGGARGGLPSVNFRDHDSGHSVVKFDSCLTNRAAHHSKGGEGRAKHRLHSSQREAHAVEPL